MNHALVVDDDFDAATALAALMASEHFTVAKAHTLLDARRQIALQPPDVVLLDLQLPDGNGIELLSDPQLMATTEMVVMTGHANLETSIQAMRLGAADYLVKPVKLNQLQAVMSRLMRPSTLDAEVADMAASINKTGRFGQLRGRSPAMLRVYEQIARVAGTGVTVFITGESGTGKEVAAQTVHELSRRRKQPFLAVNCGAISPQLIESEIFGHEKGSFTGADRQHQGFFERASGGTLFLDEVTEMPLELQVKLLRVLETGQFMRVGSTQCQEADVRIIAATNRSPLDAIAAGKLREDLFYRLNVFPIALPPLRERLSDVNLLADHFLNTIVQQEGALKRFSPSARERLLAHHWAGNVRELRNAVQRAYVMAAGDLIDHQWLLAPETPLREATLPKETCRLPSVAATAPAPLAAPFGASAGKVDEGVALPIGTSMAEAERQLILATLRHFHHHKERTAAVLGISLKTLYNRLKEYTAAGEDTAMTSPLAPAHKP